MSFKKFHPTELFNALAETRFGQSCADAKKAINAAGETFKKTSFGQRFIVPQETVGRAGVKAVFWSATATIGGVIGGAIIGDDLLKTMGDFRADVAGGTIGVIYGASHSIYQDVKHYWDNRSISI